MKVSDVEVGKTYKLLRHGERVVYKTIVIAARGDDKFLCVTLDPLNKRGRLFLLSGGESCRRLSSLLRESMSPEK